MSETPPTPAPWLDVTDVAGWLKVDVDNPDLVALTAAVADYVETTRRDLWVIEVVDGVEVSRTYTPTPSIMLAARLAANRLWSRRDSAAGLASFGEFGATEILRYDPDLERLLGVGRYAFPRIG